MTQNLTLKYKLWLDSNGKAFGEGPCDLLTLVEESGSLRQAAQSMNMSYSLAHKLVKDLEGRLGFPLIARTIGGPGGGGSTLTPEARDLLARYNRFMEEATREIERVYRKHFPE